MNLCVYGAASSAIDEAYLEAARALGRAMAERGHRLIFGAGNTGMMGALARGIREGQGEMTGIAPKFFHTPGVLFEDCTELVLTDTMRQRKQRMEDLSEGIIMAPGGIGTLDEFFEILTLKQLGRHRMPIAILNCRGYFDPLIAMLENAVQEGFLEKTGLDLFRVFDEPERLLDYMEGNAQ